MPLGGGKYEQACADAQMETGGNLVALIVMDGIHGPGFSVSSVRRDLITRLPDLLRRMAASLEKDIVQLAQGKLPELPSFDRALGLAAVHLEAGRAIEPGSGVHQEIREAAKEAGFLQHEGPGCASAGACDACSLQEEAEHVSPVYKG